MKALSSVRYIASFALGLGLAGQVAAAELELRAATIGSQQGIQMAGLNALAAHVAEATNNSADIKLFHSGSLGDQVSNIEAIDTRLLDIATIETPITTIDEDMGILSLPYLFRDREHVSNVLSGEIGQELKDKLQKQGYRVIGFYEGGFRHITNNSHAIEKPEDLDGLRIRTLAAASVSRCLMPMALTLPRCLIQNFTPPFRPVSSMAKKILSSK